jgi:hypothetical protein
VAQGLSNWQVQLLRDSEGSTTVIERGIVLSGICLRFVSSMGGVFYYQWLKL